LKVKRRIRITVVRETLLPRGASSTEVGAEARAADETAADAFAGEAWCDACAAVSPVLTAEEAAAFRGATARQSAFGGAEAGGVHYVWAGEGAPLVCLRSLLSVGAAGAPREGVEVRQAAKVLNFRRDGEWG
jgi:hypothetical protein